MDVLREFLIHAAARAICKYATFRTLKFVFAPVRAPRRTTITDRNSVDGIVFTDRVNNATAHKSCDISGAVNIAPRH